MKEYDVFISYATRDYMSDSGHVIPGNIISKIQSALNEAGITFWIDKEGLLCGDEFPTTIAQQIRNAKIFLFVSSVNSNQSDWTLNEIATARTYGKRIIPFRLDNSPYDTSIMIYLAGLQYVSYEDAPQKAMGDLVQAINTILDRPLLPSVDGVKKSPVVKFQSWLKSHWVIVLCASLFISVGGGLTAYFLSTSSTGSISFSKSDTVYMTKSGKCYHIDPNCKHIKNRSTISVPLYEAQENGKRPCKDCCK